MKRMRPKTTGVSKHLIASFALPPFRTGKDGRDGGGRGGGDGGRGGGDEGDVEILDIIGVHLKARPTDPRSCHKREGQATVIRTLVDASLRQGHHVIVLGDFNDHDADVVGVAGHRPTSRVMHMIKDVDDDGHDEMHPGLAAVDPSDQYTNWWDRDGDGVWTPGGRGARGEERSVLDHILVSESLRGRIVGAGIDHGHDPTELSDHWPMFVRLDMSPRRTGGGGGGGDSGRTGGGGGGVNDVVKGGGRTGSGGGRRAGEADTTKPSSRRGGASEELGICAGRKGARRGTAVWCRCNGKGKPVGAHGCKSKSPPCEWDGVNDEGRVGQCLSMGSGVRADVRVAGSSISDGAPWWLLTTTQWFLAVMACCAAWRCLHNMGAVKLLAVYIVRLFGGYIRLPAV
jgi:hypothetical protein